LWINWHFKRFQKIAVPRLHISFEALLEMNFWADKLSFKATNGQKESQRQTPFSQ